MTGRKKKTGSNPTSPSSLILGGTKGSATLSGTQPLDPKFVTPVEGSFQPTAAMGGGRSQKPPSPESLSSDSFEEKVKTLPDTLQVFLDHDFEAKRDKIKNLDYYLVLYHFNPKTAGRPSQKKSKLQDEYDKEVKSLIQPYMRPPPMPSEAMETDNPDSDFDPLHRKTTRPTLVAAIKKAAPGYSIPDTARIDQLLWLYKAKVDPDLKLPQATEFSRKPKALLVGRVEKETAEELRHGLQVHAPRIFVHSIALTHPSLVNLYIHFVCEAKLPEDRVPVLGFHYAVLG